MLLQISGWRKHAIHFQLSPALFTLVHSQIHFFLIFHCMFQNGCFYFLRGVPLFSFPTLGLLPALLEEAPCFFKTQSSLIEGLGCSVRFKALLSPLSPKPPWGSSLNIHERVGRHICDLEEKQRPLINLLSDIKHFSV